VKRLAAALLLLSTPAIAQIDRAALAEKLAPLAEGGNAEAAYHLGMMKLLGIGGAKDEAAAKALFAAGAEAGDPLAAYKLGDLTTDPAEALRLKAIAAEAGYALAEHDVARLHFEAGETDLALEWLTRSAQQGEAQALRALASLYNSDAIPKDGARTFAYYTLFMQRLAAPTPAQRDWLTNFSATLSDEDRTRGEAIARDWKVAPTPLTLKARAGLAAADALVADPEPAAPKPVPRRKR
jgi:uncharacterized protein